MSSVVKNPCKIYIGNVPRNLDEREIEKIFSEVGKIISLEFKGDFAFIEYDDGKVAENAIHKFDGYKIHGRLLVVEPFRYRGGDPRYRKPPPKNIQRGSYRVIITNLSTTTSSKDLKEWVENEKLNSVTIADVYNRHGLNEGVIEFKQLDDFEYALKNLDRTKLDDKYVRLYDERDYNRRKLKVYDRPPMNPRFRGGGGGPPPPMHHFSSRGGYRGGYQPRGSYHNSSSYYNNYPNSNNRNVRSRTPVNNDKYDKYDKYDKHDKHDKYDKYDKYQRKSSHDREYRRSRDRSNDNNHNNERRSNHRYNRHSSHERHRSRSRSRSRHRDRDNQSSRYRQSSRDRYGSTR